MTNADDDRDSGLRLADLVAAFSLATDLGLGQPTDHVLRSWLIASRVADHLDVSADARAPLYYVTTLAWAGAWLTKTAGTHIERIYAKTGASSRSTATLFALQHGLLDTLDPGEV